MAVVNETTRAALAHQASPTASAFGRALMFIAVVLVAIGGVAGVIIAASMGESEAVLGIALIAGGMLGAAALC